MKIDYSPRFNDVLEAVCQPVRLELIEIFDSICKQIGQDIFQIYLIGSAARGEHVSKNISGMCFVYSDVEFLVFIKKNKKANLEFIEKIIQEVQSRSKIKGICYKYDVGIFHVFRRFFMPKSLWYLELVEVGVPVYSEKFQEKLGFMPFSKFDFGNLNELLLIRMWNLLKARKKTTDKFELRMNLTRNAMELVTILVYHLQQDIFGYQKRINFFSGIDAPQEVKNFLIECYQERYENIQSKDNIEVLTKKFIDTYLYTFSKVIKLKNTSEIEFYLTNDFDPDSLWKHGSGMFKESFLKRVRRFYLDYRFFRRFEHSIFDSAVFCLKDKLRPQFLFGLIRSIASEIYEIEHELQPIWIEKKIMESKKSITQLTTLYLTGR
jgi:predicted nucleotidyltransferase